MPTLPPTSFAPAPQLPDREEVQPDPLSGGVGDAYQLASAIALATLATSTVVSGVQGGSYIWDARFAGTSVSLQGLSSDGTTWVTRATLTGSGSTGVVIGQNASLRLYNPNGSALTALSSSIS